MEGSAPTVVAFTGELDLAGVPVAEERLQRAEAEDPALLVLDLREVTFIDSIGVSMLVAASDRAAQRGRRLVVVDGEATRRTLRLTGLHELLEIVDRPPPEVPAG